MYAWKLLTRFFQLLWLQIYTWRCPNCKIFRARPAGAQLFFQKFRAHPPSKNRGSDGKIFRNSKIFRNTAVEMSVPQRLGIIPMMWATV